MTLSLPTPKEAEGTYLAYPIVRYLLSLTSTPKERHCISKDIWFNLLLGTFSPDSFDIRSSILWGKGVAEDTPSNFWVLSVLQRAEIAGIAWPNTLLVVGYRQVPSMANGIGRADDDDVGVEDIEVQPDSPNWYRIFDMLKRHLCAIRHVNTSVPEFVAVTVGRYVRFARLKGEGGTLQLIPMEKDPVFDLASQNQAVQQVLNYMSEGQEIVKM